MVLNTTFYVIILYFVTLVNQKSKKLEKFLAVKPVWAAWAGVMIQRNGKKDFF